MKHTPKEKCSETVCPSGAYGAFHSHRCSRNAVNFEDGKGYCKQHTPSLIKAKNDAAREAIEKKRAKERDRLNFERKAIRHHEELVETLIRMKTMAKDCQSLLKVCYQKLDYDYYDPKFDKELESAQSLLNKIREE